MYLKINGKDTKYNVSLQPFTTTNGYEAIRFIGEEIPETNKGFKYYDDEDNLISDLSDYKYQYRQNEYSVKDDQPFDGDGGESTPIQLSALDRLNSRVNQINNKVNEITPYKETKVGYYGEKEKTFYNVPEGNISVFFDNYSGEYKTSRIGERFIVSFDILTKQTNITVMVQ